MLPNMTPLRKSITKPPRTTAQYIRAVALLLSEETWTKKTWFRDKNGKNCGIEDACQACLEGAFDLVGTTICATNISARTRKERLVLRASKAITDAVQRRLRRQGVRTIAASNSFNMVRFNDRKNTTYEDIRAVLLSAERSAKKAA
jgi:hypothetical protein